MRSVPVLCFHRVGCRDGMPLAAFAGCLDAVARAGFTTITASALAAAMTGSANWPEKAVCLTFDDCSLDHLHLAAPLLAERSMAGTFFAVADFMAPGAVRPAPDWTTVPPAREAFLSAFSEGKRGDPRWFLNAAEVAALAAIPGMEVMPHGKSHAPVVVNFRQVADRRRGWGHDALFGEGPAFEIGSALAYEGFTRQAPHGSGPPYVRRSREARAAAVLAEVRHARQVVEAATGKPAPVFCWPWGHFDAAGTQALKDAGYAAAMTLERGPNLPVSRNGDPFRICRLAVGPDKSPAWLARKLTLYASPLLARIFAKPYRPAFSPGHVLLATDSSKASGGSRQMLDSALALSRAGLGVTVVAPEDGKLRGIAESFLPAESVFPRKNLSRPWKAMRVLRELAAERGADVIHAFHNKSAKAAVLAKLTDMTARVFLNRGVIFPPSPGLILLSRIADGVICNSRACRDLLVGRFAPTRRVSVVANAFVPPPDDLSEAPPLAEQPDVPAVLYVGNRKDYKGLDVLLDAARTLLAGNPAAARFWIVGFEPDEAMRAAVLADCGPAVEFLGWAERPRVLATMRRASLLCLPSRQESMPNVLLEAFDAGLPAVASAVGAIPDILSPAGGRLVPPGDPAALAAALAELLDLARTDPAALRRMGEINRALVRRLTPDRKGLKLLMAYSGETVLDEPSRPESPAASTPERTS